jgi:hypothetical protein
MLSASSTPSLPRRSSPIAAWSTPWSSLRLERAFRDVQGARFHPLTDGQQQKLAGRMALGLPIDG